MSGWESITPIEARIIGFVTEGHTNLEIGHLIGLSPRTVQWYLDRIFKKVGARSRAHLAALAVRQELGCTCRESGE
jgi:DNA-binding CsgD family transcriptional regulator